MYDDDDDDYDGRIVLEMIRPKKKIPVFPITRPCLIFFLQNADPSIFFFHFQKKKYKKIKKK